MMVKNHVACPHPKCGSSDAASIYRNTNSEGVEYFSGFCFSCRSPISAALVSEFYGDNFESDLLKPPPPFEPEPILALESRGWAQRRVGLEASQFYGVRNEFDSANKVSRRWYPITQEAELVGFKCRTVDPKNFFSIGTNSPRCELFGQSLFPSGGKFLIIAGGEEDAMSMYQAMKQANSKYDTPVVSPSVGEGSLASQIRNNYEWVSSFERVVLMMDNDAAGQAATEAAVKVLRPGQGYIAKLRLKDPNEYVKNKIEPELVNAFWKAERYSPAGIVGSSQTYDALLQRAKWEKVGLPEFAQELQAMLNGGPALGEITTIASASGTGKCLAKGTPVLMFDMTTRKVEDVRLGDLLMGPDGTARTVTSTCSGLDDMYRVDQVKGDSYTVNSHHVLSLMSNKDVGSRGFVKDQVVNIPVLDFMRLPKHYREHVLKGYSAGVLDFGNPMNGDDAYMLGLWLAEGDTESPRLTLCREDTYLYEFVTKWAETRGYATRTPPSTDRKGSIGVSISGGYTKVLRSLGVLGHKHVPKSYLSSSVHTRMNVLAGFIDGDGHLSCGGYELCLKDNDLVGGVVMLARSLGLRVTVADKFSKCQNFEGTIYKRIFISGHTSTIPVRLSRKKAPERKQIKDALRTGITVTPVGRGEYFGFSVDKDHLFLLGDFTVTHNSTVSNEFLYHWIMNSPYKVGIIPLESDVGELTENLMTVHMGLKLANMPDDDKELFLKESSTIAAHRTLTLTEDGEDRYIIVDHQGDVVDGDLKSKMEYLVRVCGCKLIILDPMTLALSGTSNEGTDEFMSWLLRFVKREMVSHVNIVHVRKSSGGAKANSTGADIHEESIKGSGSQFQVSMNNILLMRDKENADPLVRNTTRVVLSKARRTGKTGPAGYWYYDPETGRMEQGRDPNGDYSEMEQEMTEAGGFDDTDPDTLY